MAKPCASGPRIRYDGLYLNEYGAGLAKLHFGDYEHRQSRGADGQSRPIEIFHLQILIWPPLSCCLVDLTRRMPLSRPVSRSTRSTPSPALALPWTAMSEDPTYLVQIERSPRGPPQGRSSRAMIAVRRFLAAILATDVGARASGWRVRKHANGSDYPVSKHAWSSAAISLRPTRTNPARSSAWTLSGRWSRAIEWRGAT